MNRYSIQLSVQVSKSLASPSIQPEGGRVCLNTDVTR